MTNDEKAKAYDEALKWMRELYPGLHGATKEDAEHYFPELSENEDERIKKDIMEAVENWLPHERVEDIRAYLEMQKERKPIGGIYWHAIKKGERLPCRAYIWNPDYEKYHDCWEGRLIPNLEKISVGADTWYLPAKDVRDLPREGVDELPREQKPAEWSELTWKDIVELEGIINNVHYDFSAGIGQESFGKEVLERFRNKKDDAEVDACEQKPAWSEEKMKVLDSIIDDYEKAAKSFCGYDGKICLLKAIRDGEYDLSKQEWSEEDEKMLDAMIDIVSGTFYEPLCPRKEMLTWLKSLRPQPKQEWSEEDEKIIDTIISVLGQYINYKTVSGSSSGYATPMYSKEIDWLKSLYSQPKQEWSEEDEKMRNLAIEWAETMSGQFSFVSMDSTDFRKIATWLKSIRPSWKPTEEHLSALLAVFNDPNNIGSQTCQLALTDLYEQLKRLGVKEEPEYYQHFDPDC